MANHFFLNFQLKLSLKMIEKTSPPWSLHSQKRDTIWIKNYFLYGLRALKYKKDSERNPADNLDF